MNTVLAWFTAKRRQAIYVALGTVTVLLVAVGVLTDADAAHWLDVGQKLLAVLASLIAIVNLTPDDDPPAVDVPDPEA
jgi:hypothetical protein